MEVLVVTSQYVKEENGLFSCTENLFEILKRFRLLGNLHLCAAKYKGKCANVINTSMGEIIAGTEIDFIRGTFLFPSVNDFLVLRKKIKKVDLVIGYVPSINASFACLLSKFYKKKYMANMVGCCWDSLWNHGILGKLIAPYHFLCAKLCLKMSDFALYVTERFLQKRYPCFGLTCGCSDVKLPNVDEKVLEARLNKISEMKESTQLHLATIASNNVRYKGQHFVIRALSELKRMGITKYHYHLIGGGDKSWLENLAKRLGVAECVHFDGMIPHSQIFEKLDQMHVYIQPSLQEGLPRSVVEAMSRGVLCICANAGAMPEMIDAEYVVKRKSIDEIVTVLNEISIEDLKKQAVRNFNEAKKYEKQFLDEKRNAFFKKISISDIERNV